MNTSALIAEIGTALQQGKAIPYLGAETLALDPGFAAVPYSAEKLVEQLTSKVTVPHKIRTNLTAAAQYIENFKHRKTLVAQLSTAFANPATPNVWHRYLASLTPSLPLIVSAWYDDAMAIALREARGAAEAWGSVQGVSKSEHFSDWTHYFDASGKRSDEAVAAGWQTLLYQPIGCIRPAANFIISDSDYVEVLTEIDIQTPIPAAVQSIRTDRQFLFVGCRFRNQLERSFARQIMKRSSARHWVVVAGELTRNELRFLEEQHIERLDLGLAEFVDELINSGDGVLQSAVA